MESWRKVWREGVLPLLSEKNLKTLLEALQSDDPALVQGCTTNPPPLQCVQDWPVEACCALSYMGWKEGLDTVGEAEEYFAKLCYEVDRLLEEPAGCRHFVNWFDETPREEMRRLLSQEIQGNLDEMARLADKKTWHAFEYNDSGRGSQLTNLAKGDK